MKSKIVVSLSAGRVFAAAANFEDAGFLRVLAILTAILIVVSYHAVTHSMRALLIVCHVAPCLPGLTVMLEL